MKTSKFTPEEIKTHRKEYNKKYYEKNKERLRKHANTKYDPEQKKKYYLENREARLKYNKEYTKQKKIEKELTLVF